MFCRTLPFLTHQVCLVFTYLRAVWLSSCVSSVLTRPVARTVSAPVFYVNVRKSLRSLSTSYVDCQCAPASSRQLGSGPMSFPSTKKGSKKLPDNYRPVSLLALCSKILEKVVCEGLLQACLPALPSTQHGFLPNRSCVSNLACFLDHCWTSLTKGSQTDAIYTDYSSAFTSVSHRLLLHKLEHSFSISGLALGWVESYLSQR